MSTEPALANVPHGSSGTPVTEPSADWLIEVREVVKSFGATPALRGANLMLRRGEVVALMGPSGSGKSTLLNCAAGIERTDGGTVRYDGTDLSDLSDAGLAELRRVRFGFVFQFGQLIPELTCLQNVALPLRLAGRRRAVAQQSAREWFTRLDISHIANYYPDFASGGQAQRVAIARALISEPAVIFADEPTGALDSWQGEKVMDLLTDWVRESGASMVLVTHDSRVAAYSDREVLVRDGRTNQVVA